MPEELAKEYRRARTMSRLGAASMYLFATALCLILGIHILGFVQNGSLLSNITISEQVIAITSLAFIIVSVILLAEFLRHFGSDSSPFGKRQSLRLLIAAACFAIRSAMDSLIPSVSSTAPVGEAASLAYSSYPTIDLKVVVMVVFLACLAMVVRYGNALKEDSDSFL